MNIVYWMLLQTHLTVLHNIKLKQEANLIQKPMATHKNNSKLINSLAKHEKNSHENTFK